MFKGEHTLEKIKALEKVSFSVKRGETVGIIGKNGAGKSTLLKLIAGVSTPTFGKVQVYGRVSPLIELGAGFHPDLTGYENIFLNGVILGLREKEIKKKVNSIIEFSELEKKFINMPVKYYSSGMYMRLAFSIAIHIDPEILLVDEILAVGDFAFKQKCLRKMKEFKSKGVTILFVTHNLQQVREFCDRAILLHKGRKLKEGRSDEVVDFFIKKIKKPVKKNRS